MPIPAWSVSCLQRLIADQDAEALARVLRHDQEICSAGGRPSLLAVQLTGITQELADSIANRLLAGDVATQIPLFILRLQYKEVLGGIKAHARTIGHPNVAAHAEFQTEPALTLSELKQALRVLQFLVNVKSMSPHREVSHAITDIESRVTALESHLQEPQGPLADDAQEVHSRFPRHPNCYVCHTRLSETRSYPGYPSLCSPCGSFNLSSSELSLPSNLSLDHRSALLTGGRLNLGFHTALRLLRCGARVIVTSRYPRGAETRYREQADFGDWQERLRIVGADFRTSRDVFHLATVVKRVLAEWYPNGVPRLDILINNAAQTLTDSVKVERTAIAQETALRDLNGPNSLLVENDKGYTPRVRGGAGSRALEMSSQDSEPSPTPDADPSQTATRASETLLRFSTRPPSSWTQTLPEIPYEDVISAHSINTFVPLILIRELLPLMGTTISSSSSSSSSAATATLRADPARPPASQPLHPAGYIINVSSREGTFDSALTSPSGTGPRLRKTHHHVHTNMSKAALNMITETEAAAYWHDRRVCLNSVDPGYMSAAPGFGTNGGIPLGWEDGAGRVLWPVAMGWGEQPGAPKPVWGRFLKHYRPSRWGGEEL